MKVVVLIKQTPDTAELPKVRPDEVRSGSVQTTMVINPWDEFAAEEAILLNDRFDAESVALALGPPTATDALKHALAMGVGSAILVDHHVVGDSFTTATLLAAAIKQQGDVDLVLAGKQSVDDNSGSVYVAVATKLGYRLLSNVTKIVDIANGKLTAERSIDGGQETVEVSLPAVVSVAKEINDPRYPSFMGIRKANKAQIPVLTPTALGVEITGGQTQWTNIRKPEERSTTVQMIDGASVQEQAAKLVEALLAEKII